MDNENKQRLDGFGKAVEDVLVNPKAVERKKREAEERARLEEEQASPWTRERVERELARVSREGVFTVFDGKEVRHRANFQGHDFSGLDLSGLDLSEVNLDSAKLTGANLSGCLMTSTNLHGADLDGANLENINAQSANFHGACLCRTKISDANLRKANCYGACYEDSQGFDVEERPLTQNEEVSAKRKQSEGYKVQIIESELKVRYFGETLEGANVTGIASVCNRRMLK